MRMCGLGVGVGCEDSGLAVAVAAGFLGNIVSSGTVPGHGDLCG